MSVSCSQPHRLYCEGTEWSPVSVEGNTSEYVLSARGRITIFADGKLVFSFFNDISLDFELEADVDVRQYDGEGNEIARSPIAVNSYAQATFDPRTQRATIVLNGGDYQSQITDFGLTSNQGTATLYGHSETFTSIRVTDLDISKHLEVYIGNVLIAFVVQS